MRERKGWSFRKLLAVAALAGLAVEGGVALVACSSSSAPDEPTADGSTDTGLHDGGLADMFVPQTDTGPMTEGHCPPDGSTVTGPCDVVAQDCPLDSKGNTQECVIIGTVAQCIDVSVSEQLGKGRACCPDNASGNPCQPGLTCVGNLCGDAGLSGMTAPTGRCSPACCDDKACGVSNPEGISGTCDILIVDDNNNPLYNACTYRQRCELFQVEPCTNGEGCEIDDSQGTSTCIDTAGKTEGAPCAFKNDCGDGLICTGSGASGVCRYMCLLPGNTTSPFDAGIESLGKGHGGCGVPGGCNGGTFSDLPPWLSTCPLPDGG